MRLFTVDFIQQGLHGASWWREALVAFYLHFAREAEIQSVMPDLRRLLREANDDKRFLSCIILLAAGPTAADAVPEVKPLLKHHSVSIRRIALAILCRVGPAAYPALADIQRCCQDKDATVRRAAVAAIDRATFLGASKWRVSQVIDGLRCPDPHVVDRAVLWLAKRKHLANRALHELTDLLGTADWVTVIVVIQIIAGLGPAGSSAASALGTLLYHVDPVVRFHALRALRKIGPHARRVLPALIDTVEGESEELAYLAVEILASLGNVASEAVPALEELQVRTTSHIGCEIVSGAIRQIRTG